MKVKWWFFFYHTATVTHTDIYHIKDLQVLLRCRGTNHGKRMNGIAQGLLQASRHTDVSQSKSRPLSATYWTEYKRDRFTTNLSHSVSTVRHIGICLTVGLGLHFLYIFDNFRIFQLKLFCVCNYRHNNNLNGSNYIEGSNDIGVVKWIDNRSANKEIAQ